MTLWKSRLQAALVLPRVLLGGYFFLLLAWQIGDSGIDWSWNELQRWDHPHPPTKDKEVPLGVTLGRVVMSFQFLKTTMGFFLFQLLNNILGEENYHSFTHLVTWLSLHNKRDWQQKSIQCYLMCVLYHIGTFTRKWRLKDTIRPSVSTPGLLKNSES